MPKENCRSPEIRERSLKKELMCLSNMIRRNLDGARIGRGENITPMHGMIIGYLCRNADCDVFQKDIERVFSYRRSTASTVLGLMEEKGYIERRPVEYDARLKKIILTDKAKKFAASFEEDSKRLDEKMASGVTEDELREFFAVLDKLKNNLREE